MLRRLVKKTNQTNKVKKTRELVGKSACLVHEMCINYFLQDSKMQLPAVEREKSDGDGKHCGGDR
jgi:hypothetical protein